LETHAGFRLHPVLDKTACGGNSRICAIVVNKVGGLLLLVLRYLALSLIVITLLLPQAASQTGTLVTPPGPTAQTPNPADPAVHPQDHKGGGRDSGGSHPTTLKTPPPPARSLVWRIPAKLARIDEARDRCKTRAQCRSANQTAIRCLNEAATMAVDDQLNQADKLLLQNKPADAAVLAAPSPTPKLPCCRSPVLKTSSAKRSPGQPIKHGWPSPIGFAQ